MVYFEVQVLNIVSVIIIDLKCIFLKFIYPSKLIMQYRLSESVEPIAGISQHKMPGTVNRMPVQRRTNTHTQRHTATLYRQIRDASLPTL